MNRGPAKSVGKSLLWTTFALIPVAFYCFGCAGLASVTAMKPRIPTVVAGENELTLARQHLLAAEEEKPLLSLGEDLIAAKLSLRVLDRQPENLPAASIYNFSVARAVENVERAKIQPWRRPVSIGGHETNFSLVSPKPMDAEHDPERYDLFSTDSLQIGGKFFKTRAPVSGIGAPFVAVGRTENPRFRQQFELRRIYAPVTAVIQFSDQRAQLKLIDPTKAERVTLGKRTFPLANDFSAPTAMLIAHERPERLGFARVINPQKYADTTGLTLTQQFDPARTPVIFVHGLQETGASWAPMVDSLHHDPWIREHYQFWFYSYPSGYPYPYSAMLLRRDLDAIQRAFPNHKRVVLIGHSMGGMICRLMITDTGDKIWHAYFSTSPAKTPLASKTRKELEEVLVFNHRPEVERAIFISTPHRGSQFATGWIGRIGAALVRTPKQFASIYASTKSLLVADPAARSLKRMPNSVDTLEPNDRFVLAVDKLSMTPGIPYHSIMGDRGRGDTPNSSDGIVPYWSSHLEGARSELIVPSGHNAQYNPEAIHEVARILELNLAHSDG